MQVLETMREQPDIKGIVAGRHWRVRGEHALRGRRFERGGEIQPGGDALAYQLQDQECRVPLVHVPHRRRHAQRAQRAHAAQPQDHLLANAYRRITAVQAVSDLAVLDGVVFAVGVEQIDRDAPDIGLPDARHDVAPGDAHLYLHPAAVGIAHRFHRQIARIGFYVAGGARTPSLSTDWMK